MKPLAPKYDHHQVEQGKYQFWLKKGFFNAGDLSKKPFTIVIPPPNVTGKLHLGHTWDTTLQDIIARRKRMQGFDMLYLSGMDHAGIATQAKVDQLLREQGKSRYDMTREEYLKVAWAWKEQYAGLIRSQWEAIGLSLDYSRERFTLDEGLSEAVLEVFIQLYKKGYIYRGERIINWDIEAKTALSNIEIEHMEIEGALYYITYPFVDQKGGLTVATTRPETMFGDVALMVHPEDERFFALHGKYVFIPTTQTAIPIITDSFVDREFGTGIVKVTPAHDPNDFEVGKRHQLDMPLCMNEDGTMNERAYQYRGMERFACRKQLVIDLQKLGLLGKIETIRHAVGHSERTGVIVEPRLSKQWFVRMDELAKNAISQHQVSFIPELFQKTFQNWMESIEDWCISRQLWWGHRIPVWYREDEIYVGKSAPEGSGWRQDEDVLDTWFSSALWPFSTLGWPKDTADFNRYYPTDVLVTGYDIIFFWVARMIFQAIEFTQKSPFHECFIHGLIRDAQGKKMSKSLGNGVDPIDVIHQFGADALRYFITTNSAPGLDLRYEVEKVESSWNFINKLWNIARFVLLNLDDAVDETQLSDQDLKFPERYILAHMNQTIEEANLFFDRYDFGEAAKVIYSFTWNEFASWYIEMAKLRIHEITTKKVLKLVLLNIIKLLHPFMPFVTEEIYQNLKGSDTSICIAPWPTLYQGQVKDAFNQGWFFELIKKIRTIRNDYNVAMSKPLPYILYPTSPSIQWFLEANQDLFEKFTHPESMTFVTSISHDSKSIILDMTECTIQIPLGSLVDLESERHRLQKELARLEAEIERSQTLLRNPKFMEKAPQEKRQMEEQKYQEYLSLYQQTKQRIEVIND